MSRYTDKYHRPDYDYSEDSFGDRYGDYDELELAANAILEAADRDEPSSDPSKAPKSNNHKKKSSTSTDDEFIPYPIDVAYASEKPWENYGKKYKYTQEDLIALMDRYHNGTQEDKAYVGNQFCLMLTPMIKSTIRNMRGIDSEYLDYIQHCYMYVIKRLNRFDPTKSFVFNYFKYVIHEGITSCHEDSYGKTSHSTNIDRKVKKALRKYEGMNVNPSPSMIASMTELTVPQVEDSLTRIEAEKLILIDDQAFFEQEQVYESPLDAILQGEVSDTLQAAIDRLPKKEKEAILLSYNFANIPEDYSNKKIAKLLHVTESRVKELLVSAKRHLKRDFSLDQLLGKSKRITQREYSAYANDPVLYSFDPDCDEYQLTDTDDEAPEQEPSNKTIIMVDRYSDIWFEQY